MRVPLPDCRINNALIQFIPSCQDTQMQFVDILDSPFSDIPCSIISCLFMGIFMPKNSIVIKICHVALGGAVIIRAVERLIFLIALIARLIILIAR